MQTKNVGHMSAWSLAKSRGYTGTQGEFAQLMADYATVAERAAQSAQEAESAKEHVDEQTQIALQAAQDAAASAQSASGAHEDAASARTSAQNAQQSETDALNYKNLAQRQAENSEAWAVGTRDGVDVGSGDETYHNNAKYYAGQLDTAVETATTAATNASQSATAAATSASQAAESARTLTIDTTLTQEGQAAGAKETGYEIAGLKADLNQIIVDNKVIPTWHQGYINTSTGATGSDPNYCYCDYIEATGFTYKITGASGYNVKVALYNASKVFDSIAIALTADLPVTLRPDKGTFFRIQYGLGNASTTPSDITDDVFGLTYASFTDATFTMPGKSADAKVVGDEITGLKSDKASAKVVADISGNGINIFDKNNPAYTIDYISGDVTSGFKITAGRADRPNALIYVPCKPFAQYTITKGISNMFRAGYVKGNVEVGDTVYDYHVEPSTSTTYTMLTGEGATYIVVWVGQNMPESDFLELAETIQVEENSVSTPLTTHITGHDEVARRANNKDISILFVGNSVLEDAVAYLPYLLKSFCPELNFKIYLWYRGGRTLAEQYDGFQNNVVADRVSVAENTRRWTISNSMTMADVLASYSFDVVCMMDYYNRLNTTANASIDWNNCANYIRTNYKGGNALKFVEFIHAPSRTAIETKFNLALEGCKKVLKETNCQGLLAGGIAIYKAFSTDLDSLGDYGHLSVDGAHAQEGLPCLIQTYTILLWILGEIGVNKSIYGSATAITQTVYDSINTPGANLGTGVITGTTEQNVLAQEIAIVAYKTAQSIINQIDYLGE